MKKTLLIALLSWCGLFTATGQPLRTILAPSGPLPFNATSAPIVLKVTNDSLKSNFTSLTLQYEIWANGIALERGTVPNIAVPPHHTTTYRLPIRVPKEDRDELLLYLHYRPTPRSRSIDQPLLLQPWTGNEDFIPATGELSFNDDNNQFIIQSPSMQVIFDKQTGWLQHYAVRGRQLVLDSLGFRPNLGLPDSVPLRFQLFSSSTGSSLVIIRTEYTLPDASWHFHLSYTINAAGEMQVVELAEADTSQPARPLPRYGLTWLLPPGYDSVTWYGQIPAATSPVPPASTSSTLPHSAGTSSPTTATASPALPVPGIGHALIHSREPLINQAVRWWSVTDLSGKGFRIVADSNLLVIHAADLGATDGKPAASGTQPFPRTLALDAPPSACGTGCTNYRFGFKISPTP